MSDGLAGLHRHEYIVESAAPWHHSWQAVTSMDGCAFFIPPVEYTLRPGDRIEMWNASPLRFSAGESRYIRINGKGAPIPLV